MSECSRLEGDANDFKRLLVQSFLVVQRSSCSELWYFKIDKALKSVLLRAILCFARVRPFAYVRTERKGERKTGRTGGCVKRTRCFKEGQGKASMRGDARTADVLICLFVSVYVDLCLDVCLCVVSHATIICNCGLSFLFLQALRDSTRKRSFRPVFSFCGLPCQY